MLKSKGITDLKGQVVAISGSGNVATYTAEKVIELGGKVITLSDSVTVIFTIRMALTVKSLNLFLN